MGEIGRHFPANVRTSFRGPRLRVRLGAVLGLKSLKFKPPTVLLAMPSTLFYIYNKLLGHHALKGAVNSLAAT